MNRILKGFLVFVLGVVVAVGGGVALAATDTAGNEALKKALASHLEQHPDSELALVLAKVLIGEGGSEGVGILRPDQDESPFYKVAFRDSGALTAVVTGWEEIDIPTATTTVGEQNQLGEDVYIDQVEAELKGTVSSTFRLYVGTISSTAWNGSVAYDAGSGPRPDDLIDGSQFVTSTTRLEFTSGARNMRNSWEDQGTSGLQSVRLATSSYFVVFLQSDFGPSGGGCGDTTGASYCEQVTSSARGYTGKVWYHWRSRKTL